MRRCLVIALALVITLASCGPSEVKSVRAAAPDSVQRDFRTWYAYSMTRTPLGVAFNAHNEQGAPLTRKAFLEALAGGRYIAVRSGDGPDYALQPLSSPDKDIRLTIASMARTELGHDARVGTPLPPFSFTDIEGRSYTSAGARGKLLVLKCWFIGCKACVDEFPELNRLVDEYSGRSDVQFLSLTLDKKSALDPFLKAFPFRYAVVPDAESYVAGALGVEAYPHHLLVSPDGIVLKSTNSLKDLLPALRAALPEKG
ncbi:MAG: TlpA family protein disulfide reductase [Chitinophagaceae bacterium]|nr:MAG: TlpA family protein disulfide reductase [Chitinophagaceae bacterium]